MMPQTLAWANLPLQELARCGLWSIEWADVVVSIDISEKAPEQLLLVIYLRCVMAM